MVDERINFWLWEGLCFCYELYRLKLPGDWTENGKYNISLDQFDWELNSSVFKFRTQKNLVSIQRISFFVDTTNNCA